MKISYIKLRYTYSQEQQKSQACKTKKEKGKCIQSIFDKHTILENRGQEMIRNENPQSNEISKNKHTRTKINK